MANRKSLKNSKGEKIQRPKAEDLKNDVIIKKEFEGLEGEIYDFGINDRFGRPTVVSEYVKVKLITAFSKGCTNKEAALFAGIGERTMDNYFKKDPDFKDYCKEMKDKPTLQARETLNKAIETSPFFALQYLERKLPHEFGRRVRHTIDMPEDPSPEQEALIEKLLDENL